MLKFYFRYAICLQPEEELRNKNDFRGNTSAIMDFLKCMFISDLLLYLRCAYLLHFLYLHLQKQNEK